MAALKREVTEDAGASARRKQAALEGAAREREQRLARAIATMDEIAAMPEPKEPKASKRRGKGKGEPPAGGNASSSESAKPPAQPRASTTGPEARVMKMADGGFRPAFNAQLAVDAQTQLIASVGLVGQGSDMRQMASMHANIHERCGTTPDHLLADGGFTRLQAIQELTARGTQPVLPPSRSRNPAIDHLAPKDTDSPEPANWRPTMASEWGQALYKCKWRAPSVECANAHLRRHGQMQFNVRGTVKAKAVLLWHALAHNLMHMRSLDIAFAA